MENTKIMSILGIEIALFIIFTSSNLLLFVWNTIIGYYLLILLASFLGGAFIVDFGRSLKLVSIAFISSCIVFVLLYILPPTLYGESYTGQIDSMVAIITTNLARTVIISFPVSIFTCLFGCFSAKTFTES